ncbi:MAG: S-adenosylmethionine:tRNA ribosyltransferase-isomerase [Lentisphaeria bacterium]|nr:S-adenosylmethionine:tRNA ribosyltransferase-isomerase [Lentisphaeria bacterium]
MESCWDEKTSAVVPQNGRTRLFMYPPMRPRAVDGLLTNFHLPKSTLLMLVSTFSSAENVMAAYRRAVAENMRFYSYGDCMLIL